MITTAVVVTCSIGLGILLPMFVDLRPYPAHLEARLHLQNLAKECSIAIYRGMKLSIMQMQLESNYGGFHRHYTAIISKGNKESQCDEVSISAVPRDSSLPTFVINLRDGAKSCRPGLSEQFSPGCIDGQWDLPYKELQKY